MAQIRCLCRTGAFGGPVLRLRLTVGGYPALRHNILADLSGAADAGAENLPPARNHQQEIPVTGYNRLLIKRGGSGRYPAEPIRRKNAGTPAREAQWSE
jgi:hypothetical protein